MDALEGLGRREDSEPAMSLYVPLSKGTLCYRNGPFVSSGHIHVWWARQEITETMACTLSTTHPPACRT
jgi:hypothetical protein